MSDLSVTLTELQGHHLLMDLLHTHTFIIDLLNNFIFTGFNTNTHLIYISDLTHIHNYYSYFKVIILIILLYLHASQQHRFNFKFSFP